MQPSLTFHLKGFFDIKLKSTFFFIVVWKPESRNWGRNSFLDFLSQLKEEYKERKNNNQHYTKMCFYYDVSFIHITLCRIKKKEVCIIVLLP